MNAFVMDGHQRAALAVTRSLGRRGISVLVGADNPVSLASSSRYCAGRVTYPSPDRNPKAFQRFVLDFVRRERMDVIIPVTDVTTYLTAANEEALRHYTAVAAPPFEAFEAVTDKRALLLRAEACGIPIPATAFVDGITGLREQAERVGYPAVIKPTRSRIRARDRWLPTSVHYADTQADVWRAYARADYLRLHPSLIQERIDGDGIGVFGLFDRGRLLTAFGHRRLREKPPSGGASVLCESVEVDPELADYAVRVLGPLGWHGVAMLEFKQDRRSGKFFLIEVNGRFWGSLQLAIAAGVDFPYLACQLALRRTPDVPDAYRVGVKNRWLLGDLDHLLLRLIRGKRHLHLAVPAPSTFRTLVEFMKFVQPALYYDTIAADDPRPFRHELQCYLAGIFASAARTVRNRARRDRVAPTLAHS